MSESNQRPGLLSVLCILSFISAGLTALIFVLLLVGAGFLATSEALRPVLAAVATGGGTVFFIISLVLAVASFYGVLQMWKLKKQGFFIYSGAQVAMLVLGIVLGGGFSIFGAGLTALFIGLYYMNVKKMS